MHVQCWLFGTGRSLRKCTKSGEGEGGKERGREKQRKGDRERIEKERKKERKNRSHFPPKFVHARFK